MINPQLRVSFLERTFFVGDKSGRFVKGYEPAIIELEGKQVLGRVIDPKRLSEAEFIDTVLFTFNVPYTETDFDIREALSQDENGQKWLEQFERYHKEQYKREVSSVMAVKPLDFPQELFWSMLPEDYFDRPPNYRGPKASLMRLPSSMIYGRILPPLHFANGTPLRNVYYKRQARTPDGKEWSFSNRIPPEELLNSEGVLLGELYETQLTHHTGTFEGGFPIRHFLDVSYPVSLQDTKNNPLTIRTELIIQ